MKTTRFVVIIMVLILAMAAVPVLGMAAAAEEPSGSRGTQRIVVAEMWTSTSCYYCQYTEPAIQQLQSDYGFSKMVTLSYHGIYNAASDPFTYSEGETRGKTYYDVTGTPCCYFDGSTKASGSMGTDVNANYNRYKGIVDTRLGVTAPVSLTLSGSLSSTQADISVAVNKLDTVSQGNLYVRAVLFEDGLSHNSKPWEHVVRDYDEQAITLGSSQVNVDLTIPVDAGWVQSNLHAAVFVQSGSFKQGGVSNKEVLQTAVIDNWVPNTMPEVTIDGPADSASVEGTTPITWTATDNEDIASNLTVDIFFKNATLGWTELALGEANDGSYDWDTTSYTDGGYYLMLNVSDTWGGMTSMETGLFYVDNPDPPSVTLTYPTEYEKVMGNVTVTWTSSDPEDIQSDLKISLYHTTDGTNFNEIVTDITDMGSYKWDTTTVEDGTNYKLKVVVKDTTLLTAEYVMWDTFTIDNMDNPLITIDTPLDGKTFSGDMVVAWTAEDDEDKNLDMKYSLYLSSDDGATWTAVFEDNAYLANYKLDTTAYPNGDYQLKVVVTDTSGLTGTDVTNTPFTIYNNEAPTVVLSTPEVDGEYDRALNITYTAADGQDALADLKVSYYYSEDGESWEPIEEAAAGSTFYLWDISGVDNGEYFLKVIVADTQGVTAEVVSGIFSINNNVAPVITEFFPKGGETLPPEFAITWKANDANKDVLKVDIEFQACTDEGLCLPPEDLVTGLENTGSYGVKDLMPGKYLFTITVTEKDRADPLSASVTSSDYVIVDTDADPVGDDDVVADDDVLPDDDDSADDDTADDDAADDDTNEGSSSSSNKGASALLPMILLIVALLVVGIVVVIILVVVKGSKKKETPPQPDPQPQPEAAPAPGPAGPQQAAPMYPEQQPLQAQAQQPQPAPQQPAQQMPAPEAQQQMAPAPQQPQLPPAQNPQPEAQQQPAGPEQQPQQWQ